MAGEKPAPEIPELHIDPAMPRPAAHGSGRGLIVPSKTSVVREADLPGIRHGDITKEDVEIIINAANDLLQHGSGAAAFAIPAHCSLGVSGTIVRNGGRKIKKESDDWVPPGHVAITSGGNLSCSSYTPLGLHGQRVNEFSAAIRLSMAAAFEKKVTSVAFPALSVANGFPKNLAAALTFQGVLEHWKHEPASTVKHVRFTNYDLETVAVFKDEFERRAKESFAPHPLPANFKEALAMLPTPKESDAILGDEDVSDMLEQIALARAASGKQEKK